MRIVLFCHSLVSDWNHGNAHFLRGVVRELEGRGHDVVVYEPAGGWSRSALVRDHGEAAVTAFHDAFPALRSTEYDLATLDLDAALDGADLVLVHEWNDPQLVAAAGTHRASHDYRLLFHDTHHRAATRPADMAAFDLSGYDGVLAFGEVIRRIYLDNGWARRVWTWHEAADTRTFHPLPDVEPSGDVAWVGNWGDDERTRELEDYLLGPVKALALSGVVHGVRYPPRGKAAVAAAGLDFRGWIANHRVPEVFAAHRVTVHVPRRPYVRLLPGIPTIRVFEALACGISLVCAAWEDAEGLFEAGRDYLVARDGEEMTTHLKSVVNEPELARDLSEHGLATIRARHTCAHRVDELMAVYEEL
ncbi:MAG TPA: glycosyltransferase [Actinomycetota bacterium]|nr:glycosyltransferase [Actinomycetota bacterium]